MDKASLEALQQQNEVLNFPQEVSLKECDTLKDVASRYPCFLVHVGSNGGVMLVGARACFHLQVQFVAVKTAAILGLLEHR